MHLSIEAVIKNNSFTAGVTVAVIIVVLTSIILIFFCLHKKKISKPIKLQISDITHDSIVLEWTKPKKGGKHVTSYAILCRTNNDPPDQWQSKWTSTKERVKASGLIPRTCYLFKVRPKHGNIHGEDSDVTDSIETKPKYPGRPHHKPTPMLVTQNSISLTWDEPEYGADLVKMYNVLFCPTNCRPRQK